MCSSSGQPSHGDGDDPERVRHLPVGKLQELRSSRGAGEGDDLRGVHTAAPTVAGFADPARRLVPEDHRAEQVLTRGAGALADRCLLYTSPSPRDRTRSRMPSSA